MYTRQPYVYIYIYIHTKGTDGVSRAEDASRRDARNQLRLSCFLSVFLFLSPLLSLSLPLSLFRFLNYPASDRTFPHFQIKS